MSAPIYWEQKDPDETVNYAVLWTLAAGDTVTGSVWTDEVGAVIDANGIGPDNLSTTARVSGGVDGVPASFLNTITTAQGETLEQVVILPIIASTSAELGPYETPRPQDLVARYPAFAALPYSTLAVHIQDALSGVDTSWAVEDYAPAILSLAAHNMALLGLGSHEETSGYARAGVTALRDGAFSVQFSDKHVAAASGGKFDATPYGRLYAVLLRKNKAGPRLVGGRAVNGGWGPTAQQNDGNILPWAF